MTVFSGAARFFLASRIHSPFHPPLMPVLQRANGMPGALLFLAPPSLLAPCAILSFVAKSPGCHLPFRRLRVRERGRVCFLGKNAGAVRRLARARSFVGLSWWQRAPVLPFPTEGDANAIPSSRKRITALLYPI